MGAELFPAGGGPGHGVLVLRRSTSCPEVSQAWELPLSSPPAPGGLWAAQCRTDVPLAALALPAEHAGVSPSTGPRCTLTLPPGCALSSFQIRVTQGPLRGAAVPGARLSWL